VIGYYAHHHGSGHLRHAMTLADRLGDVTVLGSLSRPDGVQVPWVELPLDVDPADPPPRDPTAGGALHWAPLGHRGLARRMATISAWLEEARPDAVVCDVSQEVALLCRLHGVPVVSVVPPGRRDDAAHHLGLRAATRLCGFWPAAADGVLTGLPADVAARVEPLGALSRLAPRPRSVRTAGGRRLVVLGGLGGDAWTTEQVRRLEAAATGWRVDVLGPGGSWVDDPAPLLAAADVVVVQAGQNAVAEAAACRVPTIAVPAARPFDEQVATAAVLDRGPWPVVALPRLEHDDWPGLLDRVAALDGDAWATWCDGRAADRFAALVRETAGALTGTAA
jgi:hypothetical protein